MWVLDWIVDIRVAILSNESNIPLCSTSNGYNKKKRTWLLEASGKPDKEGKQNGARVAPAEGETEPETEATSD